MKTYAPKWLHGSQLRDLMAELCADVPAVAKYLDVSDRTVWRWLELDNAPRAALCALWHETPQGRETSALDTGNALMYSRAQVQNLTAENDKLRRELAHVLMMIDPGCANDVLIHVAPEVKQIRAPVRLFTGVF